MKLTHAQLSSIGPVRANNEDYLGFMDAVEPEEERTRGSVAIVADGLGGHGDGEVASRLAVETALQKLRAIFAIRWKCQQPHLADFTLQTRPSMMPVSKVKPLLGWQQR